MFDTYTVVEFFHVPLALIAVGFNASYGIGFRALRKNRNTSSTFFAGSRSWTVASRIPLTGVLLLTGL